MKLIFHAIFVYILLLLFVAVVVAVAIVVALTVSVFVCFRLGTDRGCPNSVTSWRYTKKNS